MARPLRSRPVSTPLLRLLDDPAICKDDVTFLHWLPTGAAQWSRGPVSFPDGEDDGSSWLLRLLPLKAQDYIDIPRDYWDATFDKLDPSVIHKRFGATGLVTPKALNKSAQGCRACEATLCLRAQRANPEMG